MRVTKYSGEVVKFDVEKLKKSLTKSDANADAVIAVLDLIKKELYDGITTKKIYKLAFQYLKKFSNVHAAKYNLKAAVFALGPAGFYFEKFVAKIFEQENYNIVLNVTLHGKCVSHEIDIIVNKNNITSIIECKFHGNQESKTDVKIPMYILSRFNDVKEQDCNLFNDPSVISACWIVTNSKFTEDAVQFANCSNLNLLSWNYPENNSLKDKIDNFKLYPITALTTITQSEKDKLLAQNVILVKDVIFNVKLLQTLQISASRIKNIMLEANQLC